MKLLLVPTTIVAASRFRLSVVHATIVAQSIYCILLRGGVDASREEAERDVYIKTGEWLD